MYSSNAKVHIKFMPRCRAEAVPLAEVAEMGLDFPRGVGIKRANW